jgi:hypothetical protein
MEVGYKDAEIVTRLFITHKESTVPFLIRLMGSTFEGVGRKRGRVRE